MSDFQSRIDGLSPRRLALLTAELIDRVEELERNQPEPVAVIGIGCRLANGVDGPDAFWKLLSSGVDAISEIPADRWDINAYYDPRIETPGRMCTRWGSFVDGIDGFDAPFFGVSRREAVSMDPQQRLLLEVSWEALEHSGYAPRQLSGSDTGVFVGISTADYQIKLLARGKENIDAHVATGGAHSVAAGRVSYSLGLQGPNVAVDTSCSSSLVAVHLACQSLRTGECRMALAGGVNAILSPEVSIALSHAHMMSPDGHCRAFDAQANGFVRGEGCVLVVLKKLSDALRDGDRVLAIIRGSALNQDGRSGGITAPNGAAQEAVLRRALANAGLEPHQIDYVETHGTGTLLGDPIEAHALQAVLHAGRSTPLWIGSLKTNVGHLEAAAGVAGLVKTVLALQHQEIPPHLHFQQWNAHIEWKGMPIQVPLQRTPWLGGERRRIAGVSSFGFSGTNAHVILEEAPPVTSPKRDVERPRHVLALSARSESALQQVRSRYEDALKTSTDELGDVCFTANAGRTHFDWRAVYLPSPGDLGPQIACGVAKNAAKPVFLFSGDAGQATSMGRDLYETQPVFRRSIDQCGEILREQMPGQLADVLYGATTDLMRDPRCAEPALFALEWALAEMWRSWGIEPSAVFGIRVGEHVASCVAGVYGLEEGLKLSALRGRLMDNVPVETAISQFLAATAKLEAKEPRVQFVSSLSGCALNREELQNGAYWGRQMRGPAQSQEVMRGLMRAGHNVFLEVGPGWQPPKEELSFSERAGQLWLSSLDSNNKDNWQQVLVSLGRLYVCGAEVSWVGFDAPYARRRVALPTYPFEHQRYWIEARPEGRGLKPQAGRNLPTHPFIESRLDTALPIYRCKLPLEQYPFLGSHRVNGAPVVAGAIYIELALAVGREFWQRWPVSIRELEYRDTLSLSENGTMPEMQMVLVPEGSAEASFRVLTRSEEGMDWTLHVRGTLDRNVESGEGDLEGIRARLSEEMPPEVLDRALRQCGLQLDNRSVRRVWVGHNQALAEIRLEDPYGSEFLFHPALLDAALQVLGAAVMGGSTEPREAQILTGIDSFRLFSPAAGTLYSHATVQSSSDGLRCELKIFDAKGGLVAQASGMRLQPLLTAASQKAPSDWFYVPEWQPLTQHSGAESNERWSVASLKDSLQSLASQLSSEHGFDHYAMLRPDLDRLCSAYVVRALEQMGWPLGTGKRTTTADLIQSLGIVERYHKFASRLLEILAEDGLLRRVGTEWEAACKPEGKDIRSAMYQLRNAFPEFAAELSLFDRCGTNLAGVLRGKVDPLGLLFPNGSLDEVEKIYAASPLARTANILVREAVAGAMSLLPSNSRVRILEVGAGTGSASEFVAPILPPDRTEYTFTDVSPVFTSRAGKKFERYSFFQYRRLDIEQDPESQGFGGREFDIVIASNVVHATIDLRQSMRHIRRMLGPHGVLVLLEGTAPDRWTDLTFGLTEGWWRFSDHELRPVYPLLSQAAWHDLLASEGYSETVAVQLPQPSQQAVLVSCAGPKRQADGSWLLVPDSQGVAIALQQRISRSGGHAHLVQASESVGALIDSATFDRVVDLSALDAGRDLSEDLPRQVETSLCGTLGTIQAVAKASRVVRLWLVTAGAQAVTPGERTIRPAQAPLWGLGKTMALEHPDHWGGLIDLDPGASEQGQAEALFEEIVHAGAEDQIAVRGEQRLAARFSRRARPVSQPITVHADGAYLITGGLGRLGLETARWLIARGAKHLVLSSREGLPDPTTWSAMPETSAVGQRIQRVLELQALGAAVKVEKADVSDPRQAAALIAKFATDELRGIIHTAGIFNSASLLAMTPESLVAMLRPKLHGAWHLHQLTALLQLDFFVFFSSTTSILGAANLAHYAAANQFLDAMAHYGRSLGLVGLSIEWGLWERMATASEAGKRMLEQRSLIPMAPGPALAALEAAIGCDAPVVAVAQIDWEKLKGIYETQRSRPLLQGLTTKAQQEPQQNAVPTAVVELQSVAPADRLSIVLTAIHSAAAAVLDLKVAEVDVNKGLFDLGMDSLMSMELKKRLDALFGLNLPSSLTFTYPSVRALATYLLTRLEPNLPADFVVREPKLVVPLGLREEVSGEEVSEDELLAMLAEAVESGRTL